VKKEFILLTVYCNLFQHNDSYVDTANRIKPITECNALKVRFRVCMALNSRFYSILFYSILFYSILFYSILFYSILFYSILFYSKEDRDKREINKTLHNTPYKEEL